VLKLSKRLEAGGVDGSNKATQAIAKDSKIKDIKDKTKKLVADLSPGMIIIIITYIIT